MDESGDGRAVRELHGRKDAMIGFDASDHDLDDAAWRWKVRIIVWLQGTSGVAPGYGGLPIPVSTPCWQTLRRQIPCP
jgi:hypothetical protein